MLPASIPIRPNKCYVHDHHGTILYLLYSTLNPNRVTCGNHHRTWVYIYTGTRSRISVRNSELSEIGDRYSPGMLQLHYNCLLSQKAFTSAVRRFRIYFNIRSENKSITLRIKKYLASINHIFFRYLIYV